MARFNNPKGDITKPRGLIDAHGPWWFSRSGVHQMDEIAMPAGVHTTMSGPRTIGKLVQITSITMAYARW